VCDRLRITNRFNHRLDPRVLGEPNGRRVTPVALRDGVANFETTAELIATLETQAAGTTTTCPVTTCVEG
jgi:hypothetical protein